MIFYRIKFRDTVQHVNTTVLKLPFKLVPPSKVYAYFRLYSILEHCILAINLTHHPSSCNCLTQSPYLPFTSSTKVLSHFDVPPLYHILPRSTESSVHLHDEERGPCRGGHPCLHQPGLHLRAAWTDYVELILVYHPGVCLQRRGGNYIKIHPSSHTQANFNSS